MSNKTGNRSKHKKPVHTTLGKAPFGSTNDSIDLSHLKRPIDTSVFGLRQVLGLFDTATDEVRRYIATECDVMFECRICRTIFRSIANFVLHKRDYCSDMYSMISEDSKSDFENSDFTVINEDAASDSEETNLKRKARRDLSTVLKDLANKEERREISEKVMNEEMSGKHPTEENKRDDDHSRVIHLEGIRSNKEGVYQTMGYKLQDELIKTEVMEIHSILNTNEAILTSDGKTFTFDTDLSKTTKESLVCTACDLKFATKKTLTHHIKYKHNDTRMVYFCPECKDSFANAWCVFRHLYKVHRKSSAQIRRLRDHIHSTAILKKQDLQKRKDVHVETDAQSETDSYHDYGQYCHGCGRSFERRAAFQSHIQMCSKRSAVNKEIPKNVMTQEKEKEKGARKRKTRVSLRILREIDECAYADAESKTEKISQGKTTVEELREANVKSSDDLIRDESERIDCVNDASVSDCKDVDEFTSDRINDDVIEMRDDSDEEDDVVTFSGRERRSEESEERVRSFRSDLIKVEDTQIYSPLFIVEENSNSFENKFDVDAFNEDTSKAEIELIVEENFNSFENIFDVSASNKYGSEVEIEIETTVTDDNVNTDSDLTIAIEDNDTVAIDNNVRKAIEESSEDMVYTSSDDSLSCCPTRSESVDLEIVEDRDLLEKCHPYVDWDALNCIPCSTDFACREDLIEHMACHFNWLRYECGKCGFRSYNRNVCEKHCEGSTTEAIPLSKTLETATPFTDITEENEPNQMHDTDDLQAEGSALREMIMRVIFGTQDSAPTDAQAEAAETDNARPIRKRFKTLHKDYIYDIDKIPMKRGKMTSGDGKARPTK